MAGSKQVKIIPSEWEMEILEKISGEKGVPVAAIVLQLVRENLIRLIDECRQGSDFLIDANRSEVNPLRLLLLRLAANEAVPESELTLLAHDCGVPIETLKQIRDCLIQEEEHVRSMRG